MSRLAHFDQTFIGFLHARPAGRDHSTQLILLARVAVDECGIGLTLVIELHHPQVLIPLVVDIHVAHELEGSALLQGVDLLEGVQLGDVGVNGVFGIRVDRVAAAGGHHKACHLGILGTVVGKGHRCRVARPSTHSARGSVIAHIGQQVKVCGIGGIDGDTGDAALGHRQGDGAVHIDA